ncbi:MAG: hypothetical protein K2H60_15575, partial [Muribaculaceae bacterium]|nr:hypothetical protein [Muribaculaceae bacterium]
TVFKKSVDGNDEILDPALYSYSDGIVKFKEAMADSIYVAYSNSLFPEYPLFTTPFMVKSPEDMGKPSVAITITPGDQAAGIYARVGMSGASDEHPVKFLVDFGDGTLKECNATSYGMPSEANLSGNIVAGKTLTIYVPEGESITAFGLEGFPLEGIDLSHSHDLRDLRINNTGLKNIDLRYNRCLEKLNLDDNALTELDLQGLYANWEKNVLTDLSAAHNEISNAIIIMAMQLEEIILSGNRISNFPLKDYDGLRKLDLSNNDLAGDFSLTYLLDADTIILSGNRLNRIIHDTFNHLSLLDISDNAFDIETLPYQPGAAEYIYAPQKPIELLKNAPAVNLSDQNRVLVDGQGTTFSWIKADGTPLQEGIDMICNEGATRFLKEDLGQVYCELTNPAFPDFNGSDVLRTTEVNVVGAPTVEVASFTTLEDSEIGELIIASDDNTSIYVDWRGDGSEFVPYEARKEDYNNVYEGIRTYKGANVKVYTYDSPADLTVFSVYGMKMGHFDGSPMTGLTMIGVNDAGLDKEDLILPDAPLTSLALSGNKLSEFIWADKYPNLLNLDLIGNEFETFDASVLKNLKTLYLGQNKLKDVKFDNPQIWELNLESNGLESVDLSGLKGIEQLWLADNKLTEIDVRRYRASLRNLDIAFNRFTFATMPVQTDYPNLTVYYYGNQEMVEAEISDDFMTYDLSSQAMVKDMYETTYTWFLGEPVFDSETGTLSGETLIADDEYTISEGVTRFNTKFPDDVVCVMTNDLFPRTYLRTPAYRVGYDAAVEGIDSAEENEKVDVYSLSGAIIKRRADRRDALANLPAGIYIVGGKKVFVK